MGKIESDELRDVPGAGPSAGEDREARARRRHYARPAVDIYSTESEMVVLADMPGVRKGDLEITLERDELTIEGKIAGRREAESTLPWGYHRRFKLRTAFDRERIQASLEEGILRVTLPKAATEQARKIAVD
ncbi:MAG: Hsp20/alpha crystallin family protein [Gemmatimonadota bacterium]|nr:MAG: Hsp20/alpha crystallin family protein [Gemmatimonadota bacterium]